MTDPFLDPEDLTAKARVRNVALELYARDGEDRVSMRGIAQAAGVTVGLIQHHFKTKDGIREAVEAHIVDLHRRAIAEASTSGNLQEIAAARDVAVWGMLESHPEVLDYMRRVMVHPARQRESTLLEKLTQLSRYEVRTLREANHRLSTQDEEVVVLRLAVRQFGHLFLQPMVDAMWDFLTEDDPAPPPKPALVVRTETSS